MKKFKKLFVTAMLTASMLASLVSVAQAEVSGIWLEAEEGVIVEGFSEISYNRASGRKAIKVENDNGENGQVDLSFTIEEDGVYDINVLCSQQGVMHLSPLKWSLDGSEPADAGTSYLGDRQAYPITMFLTGQSAGWYSVTQAELTAGEHVLSLYCNSCSMVENRRGLFIDVVGIAPAAWEWAPSGTRPPLPPKAPEWVELSESEVEIRGGETFELLADVGPDDASNKTVIWTSSNPAIASVDQDGIVTGISGGTAEITATAKLGSDSGFYASDSCEVTVIAAKSNVVWIGMANVVNTAQPGLGINGEMVSLGTVQPAGTVYTFDVPFAAPEEGTYDIYLAGGPHGVTHASYYSDYRIDGVSKGTITDSEFYKEMGSAGSAPSTLELTWKRLETMELDREIHTMTFEFNAPRPMTGTDYMFALKNLVLVPAGTELKLDGTAAENAAEILMSGVFINETEATEDLLLHKNLANGADITWTSSHPEIIDEEGIVERPGYFEEDTVVTLTASATIESATAEKTFEILVPKKGPYSIKGFNVAYESGEAFGSGAENETLTASAWVSDNTEEGKTAVLVLALYDENGAMVSVSPTMVTLSTELQLIEAEMLIEAEEAGYTAEAFLWTDFESKQLIEDSILTYEN